MKPLTLRISADLRQQLEDLADTEHLQLSQLIRRILSDGLRLRPIYLEALGMIDSRIMIDDTVTPADLRRSAEFLEMAITQCKGDKIDGSL